MGASIWLLALILYKLTPIPLTVLYAAAGVAGLSMLVGFLHGWLKKATIQQTARWVDGHQQLQERLSTALEVASAGSNESWRALLISDAARFAATIDPRKLFPFQLPKASRWALLLLALSAGLGFVPEYRSKEFQEKKNDTAAIKSAGQKIVELTRHTLEHRAPVLEPTRKALESVEKVGLQLAQNPTTRTEALKELASATDKLKSELKDLKKTSFKALERSARDSGHGSGAPNGELQKKIDALQKSLGKAADLNKLEKLKADLAKAQKAAAGMPDSNSPEAAAARQQMAESLANLSRQAREMGQQLPDLEKAIAALQASKPENLARDLEAATTDLEKMQETAKSLAQMQQQAQQGKDLPEQLKYGQADAAQQTLQKMIDQLKNSTPEEASKMMDEIARSVDPASPYGKAAEFLKKSTKWRMPKP